MPTYYDDKERWADMMKSAIALGGYFSAHRLVGEYAEKAWGL